MMRLITQEGNVLVSQDVFVRISKSTSTPEANASIEAVRSGATPVTLFRGTLEKCEAAMHHFRQAVYMNSPYRPGASPVIGVPWELELGDEIVNQRFVPTKLPPDTFCFSFGESR